MPDFLLRDGDGEEEVIVSGEINEMPKQLRALNLF